VTRRDELPVEGSSPVAGDRPDRSSSGRATAMARSR
jgi:hypothetical protein